MSYINGSDLLLKVGEGAVGHCTTHTTTYNSETKERAVKPEASLGKQSGLRKGKGITALSISISAEGLRFYEETESGYEEVAALWGKGQSVDVEAFERGEDEAPYLKGKFVRLIDYRSKMEYLCSMNHKNWRNEVKGIRVSVYL